MRIEKEIKFLYKNNNSNLQYLNDFLNGCLSKSNIHVLNCIKVLNKDTYYDTSTNSLYYSGSSLRLREPENRIIFKSNLQIINQNAIKRQEHDIYLKTNDDIDEKIKILLEQNDIFIPVHPVFELITKRTKYIVYLNGYEFEVCLDLCTAINQFGSLKVKFAEVEIDYNFNLSDISLEIINFFNLLCKSNKFCKHTETKYSLCIKKLLKDG